MSIDDLRKIAEEAKDRASAMAQLADWCTPHAVLALLDRVETAERELGIYDRRLERTESEYNRLETSHSILERALQRVRELHQAQPGQGARYCAECDQRYPCPTIRALEGDK